ncbi:hypothetical protein [Leptospira noguchii]|uniref:hypothetical protein n=1 Tax=Leptospira noguchii TaxID=28182 RepID=UPI00024888F4|nr:hypothetical protein [Leptospira noguchii]
MKLVFTTLTTGQAEFSSREDVGDDIIDLLKPLIKSNEFEIPFADGYMCVIDNTIFRINYKNTLLIQCGVCTNSTDSKNIWDELSKSNEIHVNAAPKASMPAHTPWLGVVTCPTLIRHVSIFSWVADFEKCVAWTIYEIKKENEQLI